MDSLAFMPRRSISLVLGMPTLPSISEAEEDEGDGADWSWDTRNDGLHAHSPMMARGAMTTTGLIGGDEGLNNLGHNSSRWAPGSVEPMVLSEPGSTNSSSSQSRRWQQLRQRSLSMNAAALGAAAVSGELRSADGVGCWEQQGRRRSLLHPLSPGSSSSSNAGGGDATDGRHEVSPAGGGGGQCGRRSQTAIPGAPALPVANRTSSSTVGTSGRHAGGIYHGGAGGLVAAVAAAAASGRAGTGPSSTHNPHGARAIASVLTHAQRLADVLRAENEALRLRLAQLNTALASRELAIRHIKEGLQVEVARPHPQAPVRPGAMVDTGGTAAAAGTRPPAAVLPAAAGARCRGQERGDGGDSKTGGITLTTTLSQQPARPPLASPTAATASSAVTGHDGVLAAVEGAATGDGGAPAFAVRTPSKPPPPLLHAGGGGSPCMSPTAAAAAGDSSGHAVRTTVARTVVPTFHAALNVGACFGGGGGGGGGAFAASAYSSPAGAAAVRVPSCHHSRRCLLPYLEGCVSGGPMPLPHQQQVPQPPMATVAMTAAPAPVPAPAECALSGPQSPPVSPNRRRHSSGGSSGSSGSYTWHEHLGAAAGSNHTKAPAPPLPARPRYSWRRRSSSGSGVAAPPLVAQV